MNNAIQNLQQAMQNGMQNRPKVGGFAHLAAHLKQAGVLSNTWQLPSCQSVFKTTLGNVVVQGTPLITGFSNIAAFNKDALIIALRLDQAGDSTFEEFLAATWQAGVVNYQVDFIAHTCTYFGVQGEYYTEQYDEVKLEH